MHVIYSKILRTEVDSLRANICQELLMDETKTKQKKKVFLYVFLRASLSLPPLVHLARSLIQLLLPSFHLSPAYTWIHHLKISQFPRNISDLLVYTWQITPYRLRDRYKHTFVFKCKLPKILAILNAIQFKCFSYEGNTQRIIQYGKIEILKLEY